MPGRWCSRPREVFILINELSSLSKALEQAGIVPLQSYRNYIPLPNVSAKAPCIRIWVKGGQVVDFEAIDRALAMQLRKFGSNQASFPGLNLISLYRVTDESEKSWLRNASRNRKASMPCSFMPYAKRMRGNRIRTAVSRIAFLQPQGKWPVCSKLPAIQKKTC